MMRFMVNQGFLMMSEVQRLASNASNMIYVFVSKATRFLDDVWRLILI